jgi:hypothetical protein
MSVSWWHFIILLLIALLYLLPTIIAYGRSHINWIPICALNILAGWTFLGWIGAFVWSLTASANKSDTHV